MKLRPKRGQKKGQMAKELVYFCLRVLLWTLIWAMGMEIAALILEWTIDLTAVLTFTAATFGGELLLLLLKRVFAKKSDDTEDTYT